MKDLKNDDVNDVAGAAIGYQKFFNRNRTWVLLEVGGRESWSGDNGSDGAVAGICDATGRVLGLRPHPDRSYLPHHMPAWRREEISPV